MRLVQVLAVALVAMAAISAAIFRFGAKGGAKVSLETERARMLKGEEYETRMNVEADGSGWIGSTLTSFKLGSGQPVRVDPFPDGKGVRLRFLGRYAGRSEGISVEISLTDPLKLIRRTDQVAKADFVLDTLPLSLLAPATPRKSRVFGFGETPVGYPGRGHELYGLEEYRSAGDTKDIVWARVAKSSDESLISRVREANVRDVVRVGVVRFAKRDDEERAAWVDSLCEALGKVGKQVLEMGSTVAFVYGHEGGARAADINELAEGVMSCSAAPDSRDVEGVVAGSDIVVTGLRELEDEGMAMTIAERPLLLIREDASPPPAFTEGSVVWTGREDVLPLVRKILER